MADLAARHLGAGVVAASDDSFGAKELLLTPGPVAFTPGRFDHKGEIVDGWETRRRRTPGFDWAVVRLGLPGVVTSVDVDTTSFAGNCPTSCRVEACAADGYPAAELLADWETLVPRTPLAPDAHNVLPVDDRRRWTHLRLCIEPDGGVGRFRVEGTPVLDPRLLDRLTIDLAGAANGGRVLSSTDDFYSSAEALIRPDEPRTMGEGWETRRRREGNRDTVVVRLAAEGSPRLIVLDTAHFVFNASSHAEVWFACAPGDPAEAELAWEPLLERVALQPDTRHQFRVEGRPATHVRLDALPDGCLARMRVIGPITASGRTELGLRWVNTLPEAQLLDVLADAEPEVVKQVLAERPLLRDHPLATGDGNPGPILTALLHGA